MASMPMDPQKDVSAAETSSEVTPRMLHTALNAGCALRTFPCKPTRAKQGLTEPGSLQSEDIPQSHKQLRGKEEMI